MTEQTTFEEVKAFGADPFGGEGDIISCGPDYVLWARMNADGTTTLCTQSLIDPVLEANALRRAETAGQRWGDGQMIASVPNVLLYGEGYYAKARAAGDKKAMLKFLDDADNAKLRTKTGRLT
jgi:hypothetical protein